jgi:imidazolonepropionase-like amidohydrolase
MEIYQADVLIDGSGGEPMQDVEIFVENGIIQDVAPAGVRERPAHTRVHANPGLTVLPGFIDVHVHLMFGSGPRTYDDVVTHDSDELMLLRGARNGYLHLRAGVTTVRDCGARNRVTFDLRKGAEAELFLAPRMQLCGRPLTITGGHFWWCNEEADGVEGVRAATRKMLKEGADFIKIMASGGGSTDSWFASYSVAELSAAVEEAHQVGKKTTAHCLAADSIARCVEAGIDQIEHFNFLQPDGSRVFDDRVAEKILERGTYMSPTIQTSYRQLERLEARESELSPPERELLDAYRYKIETKLDYVRRFYEMGAPIVMGTDAIQQFGDYALGLELLHRAGLSSMDVILAATGRAARSMGSEGEIGMVCPGMHADFIFIDGDPLTDIRALGRVVSVVQAGRTVVDKRFDMGVGVPALVDGAVHLAPVIH